MDKFKTSVCLTQIIISGLFLTARSVCALEAYLIERTIETQSMDQSNLSTPFRISTRTYITKGGIRTEEVGEQGMTKISICRTDKRKLFKLYPQKKTYEEMSFSQTEHLLSIIRKETAPMIGKDWPLIGSIHKTGNTKKIGRWNAYEVVMKAGCWTERQWISKDVKIPQEYHSGDLECILCDVFLFHGNKMKSEYYQKLEGFIVRTELEKMGVPTKLVSEIANVTKISVEPDMFEVPESYTRVKSLIERMSPDKNELLETIEETKTAASERIVVPDYQQKTLKEVLDDLSAQSGVPFRYGEGALANGWYGLDRRKESKSDLGIVTFSCSVKKGKIDYTSLRPLILKKAISDLLDSSDKITYVYRPGYIYFATKGELKSELIVRREYKLKHGIVREELRITKRKIHT